MTQCWSEGELRAFLDSELPPRDMERVAAHLTACAACGGLCADLKGRAARVSAWMDALPEPEPVAPLPYAPRRAPAGWLWPFAVSAVAASLAVTWVLLPNRVDHVSTTPAHPAPKPVIATPPPPPATPAIIRRVPRKGGPPVKPKPKIDYYIALDDEPIETGLVVRVGLNGGQVPADVIVGPDGRAHAIRLISDISGEQK